MRQSLAGVIAAARSSQSRVFSRFSRGWDLCRVARMAPAVLLCTAVLAQEQPAGEFNLTLVGDSEIVTPATAHQSNKRFMGVVNAVRQGDAAFTNLEVSFPVSANAYPAGRPRTQWHPTDPALLQQLQWMGFNLFGAANNHAMDYGTQGLLD